MAGDDEVNEHGEAGLAPTAMMEVATDDDRPKEGGVSDNEQVHVAETLGEGGTEGSGDTDETVGLVTGSQPEEEQVEGDNRDAVEEVAARGEEEATLMKENKELRERVEVLTEQVDQLINQKIDQPSEEVERSEVARLEERCVELEAELKRVTGEYNKDGEALKKKLAEAESEALRCRCEMEEAKHRATAVGEQAAAAETLQRQVTLLSAELKAAKEESEARAGEIQHATTAKNMEKREVEEAQRLLLATAAKMEKDIVALSEKVGQHMQGFDSRISSAAEVVLSNVEAIRDGKQARPKIQAQSQALVARLQNSEERNSELRAEIVSLQAQLGSYEAEANVLRDHRASTRAEVEAWQAEANRLRHEAFRGQQAMRELNKITASHTGVMMDEDEFDLQPEALLSADVGEDYNGYDTHYEVGRPESVSPSAMYWDQGGAPLELAPHLVQQVARARQEKDRTENIWSQPIVPTGANSAMTTHNVSSRQQHSRGDNRPPSSPSSRRPWSGISHDQRYPASRRSSSRPTSAAFPPSAYSYHRQPHSALPSPENDPDAVCHHATIASSPKPPIDSPAENMFRRPSSAHPTTTHHRRVWPASAPVSPGTTKGPRSPLSSPHSSASIFHRSSTHHGASSVHHDPRQGFALAAAIPHRHPGALGGQPYYHHHPGPTSGSQSAPSSPADANRRRPATANSGSSSGGGSLRAGAATQRPSTASVARSSSTATGSPVRPSSAAAGTRTTPWADVNLPKQHEDPCCRCSKCRTGKNKAAFVYEEFANKDPAPFPYLAARSRLPG